MHKIETPQFHDEIQIEDHIRRVRYGIKELNLAISNNPTLSRVLNQEQDSADPFEMRLHTVTPAGTGGSVFAIPLITIARRSMKDQINPSAVKERRLGSSGAITVIFFYHESPASATAPSDYHLTTKDTPSGLSTSLNNQPITTKPGMYPVTNERESIPFIILPDNSGPYGGILELYSYARLAFDQNGIPIQEESIDQLREQLQAEMKLSIDKEFAKKLKGRLIDPRFPNNGHEKQAEELCTLLKTDPGEFFNSLTEMFRQFPGKYDNTLHVHSYHAGTGLNNNKAEITVTEGRIQIVIDPIALPSQDGEKELLRLVSPKEESPRGKLICQFELGNDGSLETKIWAERLDIMAYTADPQVLTDYLGEPEHIANLLTYLQPETRAHEGSAVRPATQSPNRERPKNPWGDKKGRGRKPH